MNIYYENSHHVCFGLCMVNIDIFVEMVELFIDVIFEGYVIGFFSVCLKIHISVTVLCTLLKLIFHSLQMLRCSAPF